MLCVGFSLWVPEPLWLEPMRWMSFQWMSFQCKDLLIICQFSFRVVTLDFSLFDLFPFFMLEAFLKYLVASGCLYVRVKHFNRSWQKTEDVDRACTLMDWNPFFFFFLGNLQVQSPQVGNALPLPGVGDLLNFSRNSYVHPFWFHGVWCLQILSFSGFILEFGELLLVIFLFRHRFNFLLRQLTFLSSLSFKMFLLKSSCSLLSVSSDSFCGTSPF